MAVDRGRYTCLVDGAAGGERRFVTAMRARELRKKAIVVGDRVEIVGDTSGRKDTLARIVRITDRTTVLRRSADDTDSVQRVVVANADTLLIVVAAADPPPRTGFIDRCLVAAYAGGLDALLMVTKTDLASPADLVDTYADLGLEILTSHRMNNAGTLSVSLMSVVETRLAGHVTALIGHSGVGKSTLVNALVPQADRATGDVTDIGKGRHTSTSAVAFPLQAGGWIIDTPGVRSFGLAHITADDLLDAFTDLASAVEDCAPGCEHHSEAGGCALDAYVRENPTMASRLVSFRRLLDSRNGVDTAEYHHTGTDNSGRTADR